MPVHRGGKKTRKYDRDRKKCERYKLAGTREKNKKKRVAKEVHRQAKLA